jgi:hypothetical protein
MRTETFVLLLVASALYLAVGKMCWNHLLTHATTFEDAELIAMTRTTVAGRFGKLAMIALWPLWTVVAGVFFIVARLFRTESADIFATIPRLD